MVVATHNPASVAIDEIMIKVPHDNFKVAQFNGNEWADATASVICQVHQNEIEYQFEINDCNMYVKQTIMAGQVGFTKL